MLPPRTRRSSPCSVVLAAQNLVGHHVGPAGPRVTHEYLTAFYDHLTVDRSSVVNGLRPAPAQCFDLQNVKPVGQFHQSCGSGKEQCSKIRHDSKCVHIDMQLIHDFRKLFNLLNGIELSLITNQVVDSDTG